MTQGPGPTQKQVWEARNELVSYYASTGPYENMLICIHHLSDEEILQLAQRIKTNSGSLA